MILKNWSLTFLNVYKYLETISNSIDKLVHKQVFASSFCNQTSTTTLNNMNKIIELTERKKNIINLNIIIQQCITKMQPGDAKLLVLFYKDGMKSKDISSLLNIRQRTFFRKKVFAVNSFSKTLKFMGYDSSYFDEMFRNEFWLTQVYHSVVYKGIANMFDEQKAEYQFLKRLVADLSKVNTKTFNSCG